MTLLVVYKKSAYEIYFRERKLFGKKPGPNVDVSRFLNSHRHHQRTLEALRSFLKKRGIPHRETLRGALGTLGGDINGVVAVGGDGTFLEASRQVRDIPLLGINSDPERSFGHYCHATLLDFAPLVEALANGIPKVKKLLRLGFRISGKESSVAALNDLLVCHKNPAAMCRYRLVIGGRDEEQKSSGLWMATPSGSTGAILSAGGRVMALGSNRIQYRPRELFFHARHGYQLRGGVILPPLQVISMMREGLVFIDGSHRSLPFGYGESLEVFPYPHPLRMVVGVTDNTREPHPHF